ncbi:MAG TPA: leucyl aminopeptidase [Candidatus Paceibacterota bacterium]
MRFIFSTKTATFPESVVPIVITEEKETEVIKDGKGKKTLYVGIGKRTAMTHRKLVTLARQVVDIAKKNKVKKIAVNFSDFRFAHLPIGDEELASLFAQNCEMANFEFNIFKKRPKDGWNEVEEVLVLGADEKVKRGLLKGKIIGEEINKSRALANTPGGDMTPKLLAEEARKACKGTKISVKILGKKEMKKLGMGAVLGVAQGSVEEPKFIILEYKGGGKEKPASPGASQGGPIVLVGKGVTFDTGGLNLKPSNSILEMHMDMSGGAAVIHAVVLAARLKLKKNVVGLIPAVENMPSGSSYRPGDILRSMSGKTIEVLNTDAEGRVILADALTYAKKYNPRLVVDVATLTGAALVALGQRASAILTKDKKLQDLFMRLGEESGDYMWPLPLWDEYEEDIKGNFADVANIPPSGSGYGGAINGATFLYQFVKDDKANGKATYPWVHIDMAPRMTSVSGDHLAKGSAGAPIRFLVKLLEEF